jgi:hypothetical protein
MTDTLKWGPYESDPPLTDVWFFREHEIALITKALAHHAATLPYAASEREQALIVWRRLQTCRLHG